MTSLEDMIEKRHPAPGWMTMFEVANGTGYKVDRHADAVALGIWPSHGYELHGFEIKRSRGDVQKEMSDPSKADAIGKYVDFWWLVVSDLKIIDGISIPPTWGILYPKAQVLRVSRKAPKREAKAVDRAFAAAMIRNVSEQWIPKHVHEDYKKNATERVKAELEKDRAWKSQGDNHELGLLRAAIKAFEEHSGVEITSRYRAVGEGDDNNSWPKSTWELQRIGEAVKVVVQARELLGHQYRTDNPITIVEGELASVERAISSHQQAIGNRKVAADQLRALIAQLKAEA